jgi:hypothetical protein
LAFAPDGNGGTYANDWTNGLAATGGACLNAGVDLPVGSRVKAITFYYRSGPASDFYGDFRRMQLSTEVSLSLANVNPSNNAGTPASVTKNVAAVNQPVTAPARTASVYVRGMTAASSAPGSNTPTPRLVRSGPQPSRPCLVFRQVLARRAAAAGGGLARHLSAPSLPSAG